MAREGMWAARRGPVVRHMCAPPRQVGGGARRECHGAHHVNAMLRGELDALQPLPGPVKARAGQRPPCGSAQASHQARRSTLCPGPWLRGGCTMRLDKRAMSSSLCRASDMPLAVPTDDEGMDVQSRWAMLRVACRRSGRSERRLENFRRFNSHAKTVAATAALPLLLLVVATGKRLTVALRFE